MNIAVSRPSTVITIVLAALFYCAFAPGASARPQGAMPQGGQIYGEYIVSRADVLNIVVEGEADLSKKYTVDADGHIVVPLLGRVLVAGTKVRDIEQQLTKMLSDGFLKSPHVAISLDQVKGMRVFVFGNVSAPGTYPYSEGLTLLEVLVRAGYGGASEAIIVRSPNAQGPVMPDEAGAAEVIRVNLRELEKDVESGVLSRNARLKDSDTVFVPRVDRNRVFVTGQVKSPGAYSVPENTTVLQLLSLAGGVLEGASTSRIKVIRFVDGKKKELKLKLDDLVMPGDTVVVPERWF
jgi:polysaccharide biosynthesis/export protein